ncbi:hypothetical protein EC9_17620 [Rosistilla ulvae]|uniref:Uncharacterized protein n=1 Tax=Rosistilla ulvae TaxID=1930277 RepID=A0A517LY93_9BACT|nr:hypothetical protein EC9_17620 [Rosistilla ulvae]
MANHERKTLKTMQLNPINPSAAACRVPRKPALVAIVAHHQIGCIANLESLQDSPTHGDTTLQQLQRPRGKTDPAEYDLTAGSKP